MTWVTAYCRPAARLTPAGFNITSTRKRATRGAAEWSLLVKPAVPFTLPVANSACIEAVHHKADYGTWTGSAIGLPPHCRGGYPSPRPLRACGGSLVVARPASGFHRQRLVAGSPARPLPVVGEEIGAYGYVFDDSLFDGDAEPVLFEQLAQLVSVDQLDRRRAVPAGLALCIAGERPSRNE